MARTVPAAAWSAVMVLLILYPAALAAESVFLKDGSIIEGRVVRENDREVQLALSTGGRRSIPRGEILRTVYHEEYKQKRFIYLMSGEMIEGFIVDEDRETYTYRRDLASARENRVARSKVDFISKRRLEVKEKKEKVETAAVKGGKDPAAEGRVPTGTRRDEMVSRAPRVRVGTGWSNGLGYNWDNNTLITIDVAALRLRDRSGNGLDLLVRGKLHYMEQEWGNIQELRDWTGDFEIDPAIIELHSVSLTHIGLGAGVRYAHGGYLWGVMIQGYATLLAQYSFNEFYLEGADVGGNNDDIIEKFNTLGLVSGLGVELGLFKYMGIFCEINYGYAPALDNEVNLEDVSALFGLTWRTSYL
ncbi:MAG: LA_0442/LA_0875 N-terminal domain-containing protein [Spirochaetota bacterium]